MHIEMDRVTTCSTIFIVILIARSGVHLYINMMAAMRA
jgi:hypothetical protein